MDIVISNFLPLSFREFCCLFGSDILKGQIYKQKAVFVPEVYYSLIPFSQELASLFENYLNCGGFPPSMYALMENSEIVESIYDTYFNWVVSDMAKLDRSERIMTSVIQGVIKNYSSMFSLNSIAKEMEISWNS